MKKLVLLFGLLFFLAMSNVNAQTVVTQETWNATLYFECDEVYGYATGLIDINFVTHYDKDGNVDWSKMMVHSTEMVNPETGEVFTLNYSNKVEGYTPGEVVEQTLHYNLVGDMGTHLITSLTFQIDTSTGDYTIISEKTKCL